MLPLRKALADFLGAMMGPLDLATVMNPITPLSALRGRATRTTLAREIRNYEGRIDNFIGRSPLEESQNLTRNIFRVRSQVVISALQALVMHLAGLREGRKTLVFVSRGIPLMFDISLEPDFQAMLREANRGNVVIHTLDPRGLGQGIFPHDTLYRMAAETGGQAIVNTNNLSAGLERVIRDASHHYLIGYTPTRELNDGKFHRFEVKVKRRGARTVARKGYWAPTEEELTPRAGRSGRAGRLGRTDRSCRRARTTGWRTSPPASGRAPTARRRCWRSGSPSPASATAPSGCTSKHAAADGATLGTADGTLGPDGTGTARVRGAGRRTDRALHRPRRQRRGRGPLGGAGDGPGPERAHVRPGHADVRARPHRRSTSRRCARASTARPSPDREFRTTDLVVVRAAVAAGGEAAAHGDRRSADPPGQAAGLVAGAAASPASIRWSCRVRALALGEYVLRFTAHQWRRVGGGHRGLRHRPLTPLREAAVLMPVASLDAPGLADYRDVAQPDRLTAHGLFVAEGRLVVDRLVALGTYRLRSLLLTTAAAEAMADVVAQVPAARPGLRRRSRRDERGRRLQHPPRLPRPGRTPGAAALSRTPTSCREPAPARARGRQQPRQRRRVVPRRRGAGRRPGAARARLRRPAVPQGHPHVDGGHAEPALPHRDAVARRARRRATGGPAGDCLHAGGRHALALRRGPAGTGRGARRCRRPRALGRARWPRPICACGSRCTARWTRSTSRPPRRLS